MTYMYIYLQQNLGDSILIIFDHCPKTGIAIFRGSQIVTSPLALPFGPPKYGTLMYPLVSSNMAGWKIPELNGGF